MARDAYAVGPVHTLELVVVAVVVDPLEDVKLLLVVFPEARRVVPEAHAARDPVVPEAAVRACVRRRHLWLVGCLVGR